MTNQEMMQKERELLTTNSLMANMGHRLGYLDQSCRPATSIEGISQMAKQLKYNGGFFQQNRMIKDKQRSFNDALFKSYQGAFVKKFYPKYIPLMEGIREAAPVRALINPNRIKQDYDDKIISIGFEHEYKPGDIFEWVDTGTYWLIYLQELTELAYFKGNIRRCSFEIQWKDDGQLKSTFAAVRGPVETKLDTAQNHGIGIDSPNYTLHLLMPKNEDTLKQFKRYSKFFLKAGADDEPVCWRVEAVDGISTPGILEINATEYYINEQEDDVENCVIGGLIEPITNPNDEEVENTIIGETFIKPKCSYTYHFDGALLANWKVDKANLPLVFEKVDDYTIVLKWDSTYSGQFVLSYGDYNKTIVIQSLF